MKIKTLTLNNFRGFPGPGETTLNLDGKNLLVYGENGSGKSSVFHALKAFFSTSRKTLPGFLDHEGGRNQFSGAPNCSIAVEFDDNTPALSWDHSAADPGAYRADPRVIEAALRASFLDYKSLLQTNFTHGNSVITLFDVMVSSVLADFAVRDLYGQSKVLLELYAEAWYAIPSRGGNRPAETPDFVAKYGPKYGFYTRQSQKVLEGVEVARHAFNFGLQDALIALHPYLNKILNMLPADGVEITRFDFSGIEYDQDERTFFAAQIEPEIKIRMYVPPRPQSFLNEARLSALALALYFAGRCYVVPSNATYAADGLAVPLKLMVLDDVLIGLDMSNRSAVLDVLRNMFDEWQIVLLTHDRTWFEMARLEVKPEAAWKCIELYEGKREKVDFNNNVEIDEHGKPIFIPAPVVHPDHYSDLNLPKSLLSKAGDFLEQGYVPAAANYTRAAYEATLKTVCHEFGIPVPYNVEPRHVGVGVFHGAIVKWLDTKPKEKKLDLVDAMKRVEFYRTIVLNPLSHSLPWTLTKAEIGGALRAVEQLGALRRATEDLNPARLSDVQEIIAKPAPTSEVLEIGLAKLHSAFQCSLDSFCQREKIQVPYARRSARVIELWNGLIRAAPANPQPLAKFLSDAAKVALVEDWLVKKPKLEDLTRDVLRQVLDAVSTADGEKLVFDG